MDVEVDLVLARVGVEVHTGSGMFHNGWVLDIGMIMVDFFCLSGAALEPGRRIDSCLLILVPVRVDEIKKSSVFLSKLSS